VFWPSNLDGQRPVGVRLVSLLNARGEDVVVAGSEIVFAPTPDSPNYRRHDPNAHWLGNLGNGVTPTQGVVLYRQQVANSLFPTVPGDTIQVSPLVRKIAWIPTRTDDQRAGARLVDPFFALTMTSPSPERPGEPAVLEGGFPVSGPHAAGLLWAAAPSRLFNIPKDSVTLEAHRLVDASFGGALSYPAGVARTTSYVLPETVVGFGAVGGPCAAW